MQPDRCAKYTLEPLRTLGPDALDPAGVVNINKINLTRIGIVWQSGVAHTATFTADDLFQATPRESDDFPVPRNGTLTLAAFHIRFADSESDLEIRPPDTLNLGPGCDPDTIHLWLFSRGLESLENPS